MDRHEPVYSSWSGGKDSAYAAGALGVPIHFEATSWDGYEEAFVRAVLVAAKRGLRTGVFGDIDTASHRECRTGRLARRDAGAPAAVAVGVGRADA